MPGKRVRVGNDKKSKPGRGGVDMKAYGVEKPDYFGNCWVWGACR